MTNPLITRWRDLRNLDANRCASGINIKWIGADDRVWHIAGFNAGAEGAIITGPVRGMVHVPFKGVWHEPAYGPPRFERTVDERKEIAFPITLISDHEYGWFNTEACWWDGMRKDAFGWFCVFSRWGGEYYIPMQLLDSIDDELEVDPTAGDNNAQEWWVKIAADGEPRWRRPDMRPPEWVVKATDPVTTIKRDDNTFAPNIPVRVGKLRVANQGTEPSWPIFHVSAPGRCWLPDGASGRMIRVPQLFPGEHVLIDTNPAHRIAISAKDPVDNWVLNIISNIELLEWLGIDLGQERTETVLERFAGQGFNYPIAPGTTATLPVFHSTIGARVSVRLPQRFERAIS
ncbi:hypothetical protein [Mycolicibacterium sp. XJ1819]